MTPAQQLAATHPRKRERRNRSIIGCRFPVWHCRVRQRREALNLSLDRVAEALGISKTCLWQIEQGGDLMLATATKLAAFFGCRIETLWPEKL